MPTQCPPFSTTPVMPPGGTVINALGQSVNPDHVFALNDPNSETGHYYQAAAGIYWVRDANGCVVGTVTIADQNHAAWGMPCAPVYRTLEDPYWKDYVKPALIFFIAIAVLSLMVMAYRRFA